MKKSLIVLALCFICSSWLCPSTGRAQQPNASQAVYHTIEKGETLYRLTQTFRVTAEAICKANPGLSASNFTAGTVIIIPQASPDFKADESAESIASPQGLAGSHCKEMHRVERKETVYSIAKSYNLSEAELIAANPDMQRPDFKLKKGTFLCIPYSQAEIDASHPSDATLFAQARPAAAPLSHIKLAVLLPLKASGSDGKKMVEFYRGLLMAVDSVKRMNVSVDVYAYHTGTTEAEIRQVLTRPELPQVDVIFGPLSKEQRKAVDEFSLKHQVKVACPFSSKAEEVFDNPNWFTLYSPVNYIYAETYRCFLQTFAQDNIVLLTTEQSIDQFSRGLEAKLKEKGVAYWQVPLAFDEAALLKRLTLTKANVIVPGNNDVKTLNVLVPRLLAFVKAHSEYEIHLFGYPEWQMYVKNYLDDFYRFDTYFFAPFYHNPMANISTRFEHQYTRLFRAPLLAISPRMAMYGFDSGLYFLKGLSRYGRDFSTQEVYSNPLQSGFRFERVSNWGGMVNKSVWFIRYNSSHQIEKYTFQ